ncbi:branched-chain amino acid ABC transporter permease [Nocardiopsis sp. RSe5-2]|uniref:Branched-chain amino acid ABC transporter permease n=1 Tax=Nocardiopsis endophytica TaxID=3018445 RepID=A0ABT4U738_9ACTN|nr:branched-chain amino acid ABC transporter permease [Nocardiopsis endophytica]MDA2812284.1 branched-chain amino acid ABC transporter permease [Nocardiopsis endophytica]
MAPSTHPLLRHGLWALAALAAVALLTAATGPVTDLRVADVGLHLLAVAGLQLLVGTSGQVSLGHGAFMFVGAYTMALLVVNLPAVPLAAGMAAACAAGCLAGLAVGAATARLHGPYLAGATLMLAVGLPAVALRFPDLLGGANGLAFTAIGAPPALSGLVDDTQWRALVVWTAALLGLVVLATATRGRLGRHLRALRDDPTAAALSGIPVGRARVTAFVISAGAGSLAGACQAYVLGTATPSTYALTLSLVLLAALVLGGLGSLWGAFWAALAIVYVEVAGTELAHALHLDTDVRNNLPVVFFGAVLITVVLAWPRGVHGALAALGRRFRTPLQTGEAR